MLDMFQSVVACSEATAEPRRHARDWNCCLVVLSPMKMRRLPLMHWLKAAASQGFKLQAWGWKTCTAARHWQCLCSAALSGALRDRLNMSNAGPCCLADKHCCPPGQFSV